MSEATGRASGRPRKFTPEVLAAVPLWRQMGASPDQIAAVLGTTVGVLQWACSQAGISLRGPTPLSALSVVQLTQLREEAERRATSVPNLVADILRGVVDNGLYAAVLGDYDDLGTTGG